MVVARAPKFCVEPQITQLKRVLNGKIGRV